MKTKVTKKEIVKALRSLNSTEIFKVAKKYGVDVTDRKNVYNFIRNFSPSDKVYKKAYSLSYGAGDFKHFRLSVYRFRKSKITPIEIAINYAKYQKKEVKGTSYFKILVEGFNNIYWCSPIYLHSDYNKSLAFPNTEKNRKVAQLINKFLIN